MNLEDLVSYETMMKFNIYKNMLKEWNHNTLLVQVDTLNDFTMRHVLDSLQLIPLILDTESRKNDLEWGRVKSCSHCPDPLESLRFDKENKLEEVIQKKSMLSILDIGSGAGFPGMVLAMCGFSNVTLCESNLKKCIFLEEVARKTNTQVTVTNSRAENLRKEYELIVSRACCDLEMLCMFMNGISNGKGGIGIFHKGISWKNEVIDTSLRWNFDLRVHKSITNAESVILSIQKLQRHDRQE